MSGKVYQIINEVSDQHYKIFEIGFSVTQNF